MKIIDHSSKEFGQQLKQASEKCLTFSQLMQTMKLNRDTLMRLLWTHKIDFAPITRIKSGIKDESGSRMSRRKYEKKLKDEKQILIDKSVIIKEPSGYKIVEKISRGIVQFELLDETGSPKFCKEINRLNKQIRNGSLSQEGIESFLRLLNRFHRISIGGRDYDNFWKDVKIDKDGIVKNIFIHKAWREDNNIKIRQLFKVSEIESYKKLVIGKKISKKTINKEIDRILIPYRFTAKPRKATNLGRKLNNSESRMKRVKEMVNEIYNGKPNGHGTSGLKKMLYLIGEKTPVCEICSITEWLGNPISLHLDHKNGNKFDNSKDNLRILCPNCHSQTNTYAGKKR